jgi:hypothetical protein
VLNLREINRNNTHTAFASVLTYYGWVSLLFYYFCCNTDKWYLKIQLWYRFPRCWKWFGSNSVNLWTTVPRNFIRDTSLKD